MMDVSLEMNVIYSYLSGLAKVLDDMQEEMGAPPSDGEKMRIDCADRLFFLSQSVECFAKRVCKAWETADMEEWRQSREGRTA